MTELTFYGGINEIGGNKVLLEDRDRRLFLDFGFPYKRYKLFYEEYLKPRGGAGLLDPLTMGLLPPLEGVFRDDLSRPELWELFRNAPLYRQLGPVDGVLLSHAHLDHSGYISFLKEDIPVYATAMTAFIVKAMQDSGRADFDQQVCYFSPTTRGCPQGWRQEAHLADNKTLRRQRRFCIGDVRPDQLSEDAAAFWEWGFWERTSRQKALDSYPLAAHSDCCFNLRCFPVDHSIPGACAWGIETDCGWVLYSGDLRMHGKRAQLTQSFVEQAAGLRPRALILEGTNVDRQASFTERDVYQNALKAVAASSGLVVADFSARDVDRLLTFHQVAGDTGRRLAILPKDAYLLKTLRLLSDEIPDIAEDDAIVIYQDTIASRSPSVWLRSLCQDHEDKLVLASDVASAQDSFILCFSFFDLNELPSIRPVPGSLYVYSSSEPHDEEQAIDFRRLHEWLRHFGLVPFGLPVETCEGWQVPEDQRGLHASGHASGDDLLAMARQIAPEVLIPIHSEHPEFYVEQLGRNAIKVVLPSLGSRLTL
ncbi:MAG: MBL fold metallo-hydrolase [Chloroflexota bacterium]|nr:MBL fold metallo-hydrolase [Chloroflexota bacterium]